MSYRDDLDAAVKLNVALQQELDHTKTGHAAKPVDKRSFVKRNLVAFVTIFSIASYLFVAGVCYTAWLPSLTYELDKTGEKVSTGFMALIWPITCTWKLGAGIGRKVVEPKRFKEPSER